MEARIEQTDITFANIYAPNDNTNQIYFFKFQDIFFAPLSDHSAVSCSIRSDNYQKQRGPGFWKLNASLLSDNKYVELLKENIYQSKIDYCSIEDKSLKWDLIKMEIRAFTIRYSMRKARTKRIEEKEILDAINACQKKTGQTDS